LLSSACSAAGPKEATDEAAVADENDGRRNVVAQGLSRFDVESEAPEQADWEQLSSRVICVLGQNPSLYTLNGTNCYLVGTGKKRLLIDTGDKFDGTEAFMENLAKCMEEHGVEGLEGILVTHMHGDHFGNVEALQNVYGPLPVYAFQAKLDETNMVCQLRKHGLIDYFLDGDEPRYNPKTDLNPPKLPEDLDFSWATEQVRMFPGKTTAAQLQHIFFFSWNSTQYLSNLQGGVWPYKPVQDGDVISTEGATLTSIHTPGHAMDHISWLIEEEHALFSGDHVLGWGTTMVWDMRDYMTSLRRMLTLRPTRLYPGHGGFIEDAVDLLDRYMQHREQREEQVWALLSKKQRPVPIMEVVEELYPNTGKANLWMARDNVEKLFRKFVRDGAVGAWTVTRDASGVEEYTSVEVPPGYGLTKMSPDVVWGARSSMARSKL